MAKTNAQRQREKRKRQREAGIPERKLPSPPAIDAAFERLQGFPDDYTLIPWRGKPATECPDGRATSRSETRRLSLSCAGSGAALKLIWRNSHDASRLSCGSDDGPS